MLVGKDLWRCDHYLGSCRHQSVSWLQRNKLSVMPANELHISACLKHSFEYGILGYPGAMVGFICCATKAKPKHQRASQSGNPCQILSYCTISVLFLGMHDGMNMLQTRPSRWNIVSVLFPFILHFSLNL